MYRSAQKIFQDESALAKKVNYWRFHDRKIVFTNGCFDLLHLGHVEYLENARALGDVLIVGLNADASVRALKGPERPFQNEEARARILAALEFVDGVVLFEEETPVALIELVKPDVLVKGGDYQVEDVAGGDFVVANGGSVEILPFIEGHSTTALSEKMGAAAAKSASAN